MNRNHTPRKIITWLIVGALVGGLSAALDGALLGAVFGGNGDGSPGSSRMERALRWGGYFAIGGALLGAMLGGIARALAPRLILKPPDEDEPARP